MGFYQIKDVTTARIAIVIPARVDSKRLPRKALLPIEGLPMVEHVRRRGELNSLKVPVIVASGDDEILELVAKHGGDGFKSLVHHENGTSRVFEVSQAREFTHYLVLQGDELLVLPEQIDALVKAVTHNPKIDFMNLTTRLSSENEIFDQSTVKCITDLNGKILYIFRKSPLVGPTSEQMRLMLKICGVFIVSAQALKKISTSEATNLDTTESIEQLRFLELGGSILSLETSVNFPSINLPSDIAKVLSILGADANQNKILSQIISKK